MARAARRRVELSHRTLGVYSTAHKAAPTPSLLLGRHQGSGQGESSVCLVVLATNAIRTLTAVQRAA